MSYLVLARKWRPQNFEEVIGQNHVTRVLQNAIRFNRIAHAYLFSGPRGVGKTSVARIFAKALNCEKGPSPHPCGNCSQCKEIAAGKSADVIEIDGASHRGIDSIRSLQESIGYKPIKGRFKIYIIDEVHMLTMEAFNALLKTLEEPPPHVHFVFATTEVHRVPSTVLSRCQRFDFRRIPTKDISLHLGRIVEAEQVSISPLIIEAIAVEADGSLRDAETLLEQVIAFHGEGVEDEELLKLLGIVDRTTLINVLKAVIDGDRKTCLQLAQEIYESGCDEVKFLNRLLDLVHRLLIVKTMEDGSPIIKGRSNISEHEFEILADLAKKLVPEMLDIYYQILIRGIELARRSSQPHFVLEMTLLKMASAPNALFMPDIIKSVRELAGIKAGQIPIEIPAHQEQVAQKIEPIKFQPDEKLPTPRSIDDIVAEWRQFLNWLSSYDQVLHVKLANSIAQKGQKDKELIISVMPVYGEVLKTEASQEQIKNSLRSFFGTSELTLNIKEDDSISQNTKQTQKNSETNRMRREIETHPLVMEVLELFNGSIVDVRVDAYSENVIEETDVE
jgi:DNA polymerase-3 subunit gamma/tau